MRTTGRRGLHDLLTAYQGLSGFHANTMGLNDVATTYGEATDAGIHALSEKFNSFGPARKFIDLGCGIGRVAAGMAILNPALQAHGLEIVPERVRFAKEALGRLPRPVAQRIHIALGDILDKSVSLNDYAWVFVSNLMFSDAIQRALVERLAELPAGAVILCSKEFPTVPETLRLVDSGFTVPMTWSHTSNCVAYKRI